MANGIKADNAQAKFLTGSTLKHVAIMATSAAVGLMAIFLVDFVDFWFLSQLGILEIQAALGIAGTILFANISLSVGLMIGTIALVSRSVGAGDMEKARQIASSATLYVIALLSIIGLLTFVFATPLLHYLGAANKTYDLAYNYLIIIVPTLPLMGIVMVSTGIARAVGDAKRSAYITLISAITNAALDPILIFVLDLGIEGAAMASVAARLTGAAYGLYVIIHIHKMWVIPQKSSLISTLKPYFFIAGPAVLTNIATPFSNGYVQISLAEYGDEAMAAWSFIARLVPVAFGALFALSGAIGPIIGQNYGAGKFDRVKSAYLSGMLFAIGYTVFICAIIIASRHALAEQFAITGVSKELVFAFIWIACPLFLFNGVLFVANATFNTLSYAGLATLFNWGKASLGTIPFVLVGAHYYDAKGTIIGQAIGAIPFGIAGCITAWLLISKLETKNKDKKI